LTTLACLTVHRQSPDISVRVPSPQDQELGSIGAMPLSKEVRTVPIEDRSEQAGNPRGFALDLGCGFRRGQIFQNELVLNRPVKTR
jgi:hypothetical protein